MSPYNHAPFFAAKFSSHHLTSDMSQQIKFSFSESWRSRPVNSKANRTRAAAYATRIRSPGNLRNFHTVRLDGGLKSTPTFRVLTSVREPARAVPGHRVPSDRPVAPADVHRLERQPATQFRDPEVAEFALSGIPMVGQIMVFLGRPTPSIWMRSYARLLMGCAVIGNVALFVMGFRVIGSRQPCLFSGLEHVTSY